MSDLQTLQSRSNQLRRDLATLCDGMRIRRFGVEQHHATVVLLCGYRDLCDELMAELNGYEQAVDLIERAANRDY
jgi:hypothetical protein